MRKQINIVNEKLKKTSNYLFQNKFIGEGIKALFLGDDRYDFFILASF
jgi:hypothetical protein